MDVCMLLQSDDADALVLALYTSSGMWQQGAHEASLAACR